MQIMGLELKEYLLLKEIILLKVNLLKHRSILTSLKLNCVLLQQWKPKEMDMSKITFLLAVVGVTAVKEISTRDYFGDMLADMLKQKICFKT